MQMPILHEGIHYCEHCHKSFDWIHFELEKQKLREAITFEKIPDRLKAHRFMPISSGQYEVEVNCPFCYYDNHFIYPEE